MWLDPPGGGCNIPTYLTTMLLLAVLALTNGESTSRKKKKNKRKKEKNITWRAMTVNSISLDERMDLDLVMQQCLGSWKWLRYY